MVIDHRSSYVLPDPRGTCEHAYGVVEVNRYPSFDALLGGEDLARIAPEHPEPDSLMRVLREIYPPEKEALGVLAIHVKPDDNEDRKELELS
jgi:ASC-1-like (ASCH) protein